MEGLKRFDVVSGSGATMVVIESEFLPPDASVVIVPLVQGYPALPGLNPSIDFDGQTYVLATRLIAAVRRTRVQRIGSVARDHDKIIRAVDTLTSGF